ncbi:MAG: hypothetical protein ACOYVD_07510 [Bacillota bacterium]
MSTTKKILGISIAALIVSLVVEVLFVHPHAKFWWHEFIGFDIIYGFLGCLLLMGVSKGLGMIFISKPEKFYGGGEDNDE